MGEQPKMMSGLNRAPAKMDSFAQIDPSNEECAKELTQRTQAKVFKAQKHVFNYKLAIKQAPSLQQITVKLSPKRMPSMYTYQTQDTQISQVQSPDSYRRTLQRLNTQE